MYIVFNEDSPGITKGKRYEILSVEETFNSDSEKITSYYTILKENGVEFTFSSEGGIDYEVIETENIDNVTNPSHYTNGNIETIDYLKDTLSKEQYEGFCRGNVLKYLSRYPHKNGVEDLNKAKTYLEWLIESVEE